MGIFISYSRDDRARLAGVLSDLEQFGRDVFLDEKVRAGQAWWSRILSEIRSCEAFLIVVSRASVSSEACELETGYALALDKTIVPIRLDDVEPTEAPGAISQVLRRSQWIDYRQGDKQETVRLLRALVELDTASEPPDPLPPEPDPPGSYISDLQDDVESTDQMDMERQWALYIRFEEAFESGKDSVDVHRLLVKFRHRGDLLAKVGDRIDRLVGEMAGMLDDGDKNSPDRLPPTRKPTEQGLSEIDATVRTADALTSRQQADIIRELREAAGNAEPSDSIVEILSAMRSRGDLDSSVAADIDQMLVSEGAEATLDASSPSGDPDGTEMDSFSAEIVKSDVAALGGQHKANGLDISVTLGEAHLLVYRNDGSDATLECDGNEVATVNTLGLEALTFGSADFGFAVSETDASWALRLSVKIARSNDRIRWVTLRVAKVEELPESDESDESEGLEALMEGSREILNARFE